MQCCVGVKCFNFRSAVDDVTGSAVDDAMEFIVDDATESAVDGATIPWNSAAWVEPPDSALDGLALAEERDMVTTGERFVG